MPIPNEKSRLDIDLDCLLTYSVEQKTTDTKLVHLTNNSGNEEWYTPKEYIEAAREVMGSIDLDPASCDEAQKTVKAGTYYTKQDNGLFKPWFGNVWMNPPYSAGRVEYFIRRLVEQYADDNVKSAIVLVNNATDTDWFQTLMYVTSGLCLVRSRIKFNVNATKKLGTPLQGQVIAYVGTDHCEKFYSVFRKFGTVMKPFST